MNLEDAKKLTVADLRKELKTRNLPINGNKGELLQRLSEHLLTEEHQILGTSSAGDEDSDYSNLLEGVSEDVVLGLTPSKTSPSAQPSQKKVTLKTNSNKAVPLPDSPTPDSLKEKPDVANPTADTSNVPARSAKTKITVAESSTTTAATGASLTSEEKRLERAKKFNLPSSDDDRKRQRQERFQTETESTDSKTSAKSIQNSGTADQEKLEQRAARFGHQSIAKTAASDPATNEKLKARAERFGIQVSANDATKSSNGSAQTAISDADKEKLLKRKMRFEGGAGGAGETDEKKRLRAERFGQI